MIKIVSAKGFTTDELNQLNAAVAAANKAIASPDFASAVVAANFFMPPTSNALILNTLRATLNIAVAFEIASYPWYNFGKRREVAHEVANGTVVFNRRFFDAEHLAEHANTVAHEACHVLGYSHPYEPSVDRDNSVPYKVGSFVETIVGAASET